MSTYCKVTVLMDERRLDMALPGTVPVSELLSQLLPLATGPQNRSQPQGWRLSKLDGRPLSPNESLGDAQVLNGDFLRLDGVGSPTEIAVVEDVRDAVEDLVDASRRLWNPQITLDLACAATALLGLGLLALTATQRIGTPAHATGSALGCALAIAVGAGLTRRRAHAVSVTLLLVTAYGWAALTGWAGATHLAAPMAARLPAALGGALVLATLVWTVIPEARVHLTALLVLTITGGILAAAQQQGWDPLQVARGAAPLAVLAVGALPRASIALGGLAAADYRVRNFGQLTNEQLRARLRRGDQLLIGVLVGLSGVVATASVALSHSSARWDLPLAGALGILALLRSRVFSQIPHILPIRAAGAMALASCGYHLIPREPHLAGWVASIGVASAVLVIWISGISLSDIGRARVKRALNRVEFLAVASTVAVAATAAGLFDLATRLTR